MADHVAAPPSPRYSPRGTPQGPPGTAPRQQTSTGRPPPHLLSKRKRTPVTLQHHLAWFSSPRDFDPVIALSNRHSPTHLLHPLLTCFSYTPISPHDSTDPTPDPNLDIASDIYRTHVHIRPVCLPRLCRAETNCPRLPGNRNPAPSLVGNLCCDGNAWPLLPPLPAFYRPAQTTLTTLRIDDHQRL